MQVSSDLNVIDLDVPFTLSFSISATLNAYINLDVLCFFTWPILFTAAPIIVMAVRLQVSLFNTCFSWMNLEIFYCFLINSFDETLYCRDTIQPLQKN